jgi:hypothetical protein
MIWRIALVLAVLQLMASIALYGVYWAPWSWFEVVGQSTLNNSLMFLASLLFIALPVAAVFGILRNSRLGLIALSIYPAVAWMFGAIPVPFASAFFTEDIGFNSLIITIVDGLAILLGVVLLAKCQPRPNNALH